jgi:hypothetical protein
MFFITDAEFTTSWRQSLAVLHAYKQSHFILPLIDSSTPSGPLDINVSCINMIILLVISLQRKELVCAT